MSKNQKDKDDRSVLGQPMLLGATSIQQVLNARNRATNEVVSCLENESDLILECKVCKSLFRSLANFIAHKRVYCQKQYKDMTSELVREFPQEPITLVIQPTEPDEHAACTSSPVANKSALLNDVKKRPKRQPPSNPTSNPQVHSDTKVVQLSSIKGVDTAVAQHQKTKSSAIVQESEISTPETYPEELMEEDQEEFESTEDNDPSFIVKEKVTVVQPEDGYPNMNLRNRPGRGNRGRPPKKKTMTSPQLKGTAAAASGSPSKSSFANSLIGRADCDVKNLKCLQCDQKYSSVKTLTFHMLNLHSEERKFFPCIYCKSVFSQFWGATRHMKRAHGKSKEHIDKIRDLLRTKAFTKAAFQEHRRSEKNVTQKIGDGKEILINSASGPRTSADSSTPQLSKQSSGEPMPLFMCCFCNKAFSKKSSLMRHRDTCKKNIVDNVNGNGQPGVRPKRNIKPKQFYDGTNSHIPEIVRIKKEDGSSVYKLKKDAEESLLCDQLLVDDKSKQSDDSYVKARDAKCVRVLVQGESVPLLDADDEAKIDRMVDMRKLVCLRCKRQYGSGSNLRRHAVRHLGWRRYKCKLCKFTSYNKSECKSHLRRSHSLQVGQLIDSGVMENIIDLNSLLDDEDKASTGFKNKGAAASSSASDEFPESSEVPMSKPIRGVTYIKEPSPVPMVVEPLNVPEAQSTTETSQPSADEEPIPAVKRGRGRPKKIAAGVAGPTQANSDPVYPAKSAGRPRGRPPKQTTLANIAPKPPGINLNREVTIPNNNSMAAILIPPVQTGTQYDDTESAMTEAVPEVWPGVSSSTLVVPKPEPEATTMKATKLEGVLSKLMKKVPTAVEDLAEGKSATANVKTEVTQAY